jgi:hypothetical protein
MTRYGVVTSNKQKAINQLEKIINEHCEEPIIFVNSSSYIVEFSSENISCQWIDPTQNSKQRRYNKLFCDKELQQEQYKNLFKCKVFPLLNMEQNDIVWF